MLSIGTSPLDFFIFLIIIIIYIVHLKAGKGALGMSERITSYKALAELVSEWGFLPFFKNEISGFSVEEHTPSELWFADGAEGPWEWKGPAVKESGCAYGKFFRNKAGFISREWYIDFANYRRDGYDFDARYEDGLASHRDKRAYDILEQHDSLLSKELKRLWSAAEGDRKGFDTIMTRLQMQGYITTVDFEYQRDKQGNAYGWGIARYAVSERHFGDMFRENVYNISPEKSKERIVRHLSALFPQTDEEQILKIIK